jgi:predicted permease
MRRFIRLPLTSRAAISADVDDEIRTHLDERIRRLVDDGMSLDEARRVALERFGDVETTRRAMRDSAQRHASRMIRRDRLHGIAQDMRHTLRQLRRAPSLTSVVIVTLGLGIGATATMFGVVDRLLLRPPAQIRDPGRLGRLYTSHLDGPNRAVDQDEVSYVRFTQLRDGARSVADVAAMGSMPVVVGRGMGARRVLAGFVSANFWPLLGVQPSLGRVFGADEDRPPDGANVVVLGNAYWRIVFGSDSSVIGREIDVGTRRLTVIGVAPRDFHGITQTRIDLWLPVTAVRIREKNSPADWYKRNDLWWLAIVARLYPTATPQQAESVLTATFARVSMGGLIDDATVRQRARVSFGPLLEERGPRRQESTRIATWVAAIAGIVLLLACSNVANLLLARAIRRRREIAVRIALGVSRGRLFAQLLVEGLLLSTAGGVVGLTVALVGGRALSALLLPNVAASERVFDGRVMVFATFASVAAGVLASLAPAVFALRQDLSTMMKPMNRDGSTRRLPLRTVLLAGQVALSTTLLLGAGLFIRSLQQARSTQLGFDARGLITVTAERLEAGGGRDDMSALYRQFAERLRSVPGVLHATTTIQIPFWLSGSTSISVPGIDSATLERIGEMRMNSVGIDYFETMGTRIVRGRSLDARDGATSPRVIVVSDSMARALWPGADPIGKCVRVGGGEEPCSVVVGVAENIHQYEVRPEPVLQYWFPESQNQGGNGGAYAVMVRVAGNPRAMFPTLRQVLQSVAPPSTYISLAVLDDAVSRVVRPWRMGAMVLSAFGALGLIIAAMGLYSVLAYTVSQRSAELGLRMALGATPRHVIARVIFDGLIVVTAGLGAGLALALVAGRSIDAVLFGVTTADPLVIPLTVATLLSAALVASAIPAWRASRLDPAQALRAE